MDAEAVRERATGLPREPGVYQFMAGERALYVGKAVDLRSRVRSYADPRSPRIRRMVEEASDLEVAVTDTETQALLLEANFIKRLQPQYNVLLTDDKSYPLVQLTDHPFPRIEVTRDPEEGATVYGPYTVRGRVDTVVKALRETFGVRGCSDHKFASRDRPCLDYDIGLCTAPCTAEIGRDDYLDDVGSVREFLEGATGVLADPLEAEMERAARDRDYERAAHLRDRIEVVRAFHEGMGDAVDARREHRTTDVLGAVVEGETAVVARLHAEGGQLVERDRHRLKAPRATRVPTALAAFIPQYYAERELPDRLLLSDHHGDDEIDAWLAREGIEVSVPGTGRESRLVDLALKNARLHVDDDEAGRLAEALGIGPVERIEGFDVSHAGGRSVVGSNVVFVGGAPEKAGYRRKRLTEVNDDYANTAELLDWRARRAVEGRDDRPDPDLLLIDGGEGQLEAARGAIEAAKWDVPIVALAKEGEVVVTAEGRFDWPDDAPHLHLLQRVRDEAHRFAVQYHRHRRDDVSTVLDGVEGIGPDRRRRLLRRFGSVEGIRSASTAELRSVEGIGPTTAERLKRRL